jgi:2-polyprenyl-3-methyl-5-hydroxy-6-metoxy-1,4-benzoquinol methylase
MNCRFCNASLNKVFIDLGESPPSNSFLNAADLNKPEARYPLKVYVCESCFLVQIGELKKATDIFSNEYAYFSSFSTTWLAHAKQYVDMMIGRFHFDQKSKVIEIASNDGYLLQYFKQHNIPVLGIEPTANTAKVAIEKGIDTITDFFGVKLANKLASEGKKADLLLGNNVLAHVPDINDFVKGLKLVLNPTGVITMEFPHLVQLVENSQFDTIYHEHFSYLSFSVVVKIFAQNGLEMFDVEEIPTHGGSLRIYAKHKEDSSKLISEKVKLLLDKENKLGVNSIVYYANFQQKIDTIKTSFLKFLHEAKKQGKKVCGYGAAAKGNTLLNYCDITSELITFVVDASPHKQSKYMPGSKIPVVSEQTIKDTHPDYIVIFPWNIKDEIIKQLLYIRGWNGKFVVVIPEFMAL